MRTLAALLFATNTVFAAATLNVFDRTWTVPNASDWSVDQDKAPVLHLVTPRGPVPGPPRRPTQFALTEVPDVDKLTIEADVKPLKRSLIIVYAYRDEAHFNYVHFSTDTAMKQPVHNGVFHVFGGERVRISPQEGRAAFAAANRWYHVTITYDAATGTVQASVDGEPVPALHAVDLSLGQGKIGLGSFDETADFKNVKIMAASSVAVPQPAR